MKRRPDFFIINSMKGPAARWQAIADGAIEIFNELLARLRATKFL
jgi:hypothetical protein